MAGVRESLRAEVPARRWPGLSYSRRTTPMTMCWNGFSGSYRDRLRGPAWACRPGVSTERRGAVPPADRDRDRRPFPFRTCPLTVVSSKVTAGLTTSPAQATTYVDRQQQLAALSPRGRHITTSNSSDQRSGARCENHPRHCHRRLNLNENPSERAARRTRRCRRETEMLSLGRRASW